MKLKNKKTGEIREMFIYNGGDYIRVYKTGLEYIEYHSLAELCEEWEDYEEPKEFWWVRYDGAITHAEIGTMSFTKQKQIGNYFETKEEAEKAVEKLKALKRLKDAGFRFTGINDDEASQYSCNQTGILCEISEEEKPTKLCRDKDFLTIFGGEK